MCAPPSVAGLSPLPLSSSLVRCSRRSVRVILSLIVGCAAVSGCGDEESPQLLPVNGRVLLDGAPLGPGSLSLRPEPGGSWDQPAGMIADDGSYRVFTNGHAGAPAGKYTIVVFIHEQPAEPGAAHPGLPQSLIPTRYNDPATSGLSLTITSDAPPDAYDLKLTSHAD